jgi:germacradienol/geosmin synthase
MGMFDGSVWTEDRFTREDIGGRAGHLLPDANPQQLALASDWTAWSLFVNDYALELFKRRRDLLGAKAFAGRLASFVGEGSITGTPINPAERALADLWRRTAAVSSVELRRSLAARVQDYVASTAWEIFNALQDRTPDPIDYCEMRRITGRGLLALSFVQLPGEIPLPAGVVRDRMIGQLCAGFCDVMPLRNDILSYAKEVRTEGEIINGVTVMQRFFDCDPTRAMAILAALVDSRLAQFQHIVAHHLPELFADLELDEPTRANVRRWVGRLEDWIAGDLEWSRRTPRYDQDPRATAPISAASAFVRGPTGLGTSAARVPELLRRPVPEPGVDVPVTIVPNGNTLDDKLRELARRATLGR